VTDLGGEDLAQWRLMHRTDSDEDNWSGHALPDLLRVWDWALRIDEDPSKYEGGPA